MTVLIVDESPLARNYLQRFIKEGETRTSASIRDGIVDAAAWQPSVILLDVFFAKEPRTGIDAIPDFRAASSRSEIIVFSSVYEKAHELAAIKMGAFSYCEKGDEAVLRMLIQGARKAVSSSFVSASSSIH